MKRVSILAVSLSKLSLYMHSILTRQPPAMISRVFTENTLNSPAYFLNQLTFVTSQTSSVYLVVACLLCFSWSSRSYCWLWSTTSIRSTRKNSSNDKIFKGLRSRSEWYWEIVEPGLGSWRWLKILCKASGTSWETNHMWQNTQVSPLYKSDCPLSSSCAWKKSLLFAMKKDLITYTLFYFMSALCSEFISVKYKISKCGAL